MKRRFFISLLCLIVLMFQLLPVRQLGNMLFSNQLQEELPYAMDDIEKGMKENSDFRKDCYTLHNLTPVVVISNVKNCYFHFAIALPLAHTGEIHTPPPNYGWL